MGKEEGEWLWGKKKEIDYGEGRKRMIMGKEEREWLWGKEKIMMMGKSIIMGNGEWLRGKERERKRYSWKAR